MIARTPLDQQSGHLMIIDEGSSRDTVEQGLGQIVEIHPRRIPRIIHDNMHVIVALARADFGKVVAKEFSQKLFVIARLRGQTRTADFQRTIFSDPPTDLVRLDPAIQGLINPACKFAAHNVFNNIDRRFTVVQAGNHRIVFTTRFQELLFTLHRHLFQRLQTI